MGYTGAHRDILNPGNKWSILQSIRALRLVKTMFSSIGNMEASAGRGGKGCAVVGW